MTLRQQQGPATMLRKLRLWWTLDTSAEQQSADNPFGPLSPYQHRDTGPLLPGVLGVRLGHARAEAEAGAGAGAGAG